MRMYWRLSLTTFELKLTKYLMKTTLLTLLMAAGALGSVAHSGHRPMKHPPKPVPPLPLPGGAGPRNFNFGRDRGTISAKSAPVKWSNMPLCLPTRDGDIEIKMCGPDAAVPPLDLGQGG